MEDVEVDFNSSQRAVDEDDSGQADGVLEGATQHELRDDREIQNHGTTSDAYQLLQSDYKRLSDQYAALLQEVRVLKAEQQRISQEHALLTEYWKKERQMDAQRQRLAAELDAKLSTLERRHVGSHSDGRLSSNGFHPFINGAASLPNSRPKRRSRQRPIPADSMTDYRHPATTGTSSGPSGDQAMSEDQPTLPADHTMAYQQPIDSPAHWSAPNVAEGMPPASTPTTDHQQTLPELLSGPHIGLGEPAASPSSRSRYQLSTRTKTVRELWREWHEGLGDDKPSVITLNALYGADWRKGQPHAQLYSRRKRVIDYVHFLREHQFDGHEEPAIQLLDDMMVANKWKTLDKLKRSVCDPWYRSVKPTTPS